MKNLQDLGDVEGKDAVKISFTLSLIIEGIGGSNRMLLWIYSRFSGKTRVDERQAEVLIVEMQRESLIVRRVSNTKLLYGSMI